MDPAEELSRRIAAPQDFDADDRAKVWVKAWDAIKADDEFDAIAAQVRRAEAAALGVDLDVLGVAAVNFVSPGTFAQSLKGVDSAADVETAREAEGNLGFCAYAIERRGFILILDALADPAFCENHFALYGGFRGYAADTFMFDGQPIGTVSIGSKQPLPYRPRIIRRQLRVGVRQVEKILTDRYGR